MTPKIVAQPEFVDITGPHGKWTLKVALKWCPYAHNLKLALYTRIGLPGASSTSNFVQLASGSAYMFVQPKYH